jgi:hypothetical protein
MGSEFISRNAVSLHRCLCCELHELAYTRASTQLLSVIPVPKVSRDPQDFSPGGKHLGPIKLRISGRHLITYCKVSSGLEWLRAASIQFPVTAYSLYHSHGTHSGKDSLWKDPTI